MKLLVTRTTVETQEVEIDPYSEDFSSQSEQAISTACDYGNQYNWESRTTLSVTELE
jgi:hypothetical protein